MGTLEGWKVENLPPRMEDLHGGVEQDAVKEVWQ